MTREQVPRRQKKDRPGRQVSLEQQFSKALRLHAEATAQQHATTEREKVRFLHWHHSIKRQKTSPWSMKPNHRPSKEPHCRSAPAATACHLPVPFSLFTGHFQ